MSALNGLQSNFQVLSEMRKQPRSRAKHIFSKTPEFLSRIGIDVKKIHTPLISHIKLSNYALPPLLFLLKVTELDSLNVIHVAGTKGKVMNISMCYNLIIIIILVHLDK